MFHTAEVVFVSTLQSQTSAYLIVCVWKVFWVVLGLTPSLTLEKPPLRRCLDWGGRQQNSCRLDSQFWSTSSRVSTPIFHLPYTDGHRWGTPRAPPKTPLTGLQSLWLNFDHSHESSASSLRMCDPKKAALDAREGPSRHVLAPDFGLQCPSGSGSG